MKRIDKLFGHRLWMTPLASYLGFAGMVYATYALAAGAASLWWILPMLILTFMMLMGITVGMHRLFCHAAFRTSIFWHAVLAYFGTLAIYGSSVQWPAMHATHHKFSDTDKDPHYTGWRYLFWKKNRPTIFNRKIVLRQFRNPLHRFLHRYYSLVVLGTASLLVLAGGLNALVFCYLVPLGWLHFVGSAHQVYAHGADGPHDLPIMEFVLFTGGEWQHCHHHDKPRDVRFGKYDLGYRFIQMIRTG